MKEFAQCADVGCSDAGHYCSLVLPSAVRRLTLEAARGAAVAVPFTRCRSSSPIRCRPRLCTTRRIGAIPVGREPIAVAATAAAGIGDRPVGTWLVLRGHAATSCPAHVTLLADPAGRSGLTICRRLPPCRHAGCRSCGTPRWLRSVASGQPGLHRTARSAFEFTAPISCVQPRPALCAAARQVASGRAPGFAAPRRR